MIRAIHQIAILSILLPTSVYSVQAQQNDSSQPQPVDKSSVPISEEQKKELRARRDELASKARKQQKDGQINNALDLLEQVYELDVAILGKAHEKLLDRLGKLAQLAFDDSQFERAFDYRKRAIEVGKLLYQPSSIYFYKLGDLHRELNDAKLVAALTADQREEISESNQLQSQVELLYQQGKTKQALELAERSLQLRLTILGKEHPGCAMSLNNTAVIYTALADYAKAELLCVEALAIREKMLGKDHPDYANSLNNLAQIYHSKGDFIKAEPLLLEAKTTNERVFGKRHPEYAVNLYNLASLYFVTGQYGKAEPLLLEAHEINENVLGKDHPAYANTLRSLGGLYQSRSEYRKAEPLLVKAHETIERLLGRSHPQFVVSLSSLGTLYFNMEDYARAEPFLVEALANSQELLGKNSPLYASSLRELAVLYVAMSNYDKSEVLFKEALSIISDSLGTEHPEYADLLNGLASLYYSMSDFSGAEFLYLEAKSIRENLLGKEHPDSVTILKGLASTYHSMGDYARSEPLFLEAKSIEEKVLGKEHLSHAATLNNLAALYKSMADYEKAESLYIEARMIQEKALGREHLSYAKTLNNLAALYESMADYGKAEPLYLEARAIQEKVLGKEHPSNAEVLINLASLYHSQAEYEKAESLYLEAKSIKVKSHGKDNPIYATCLNNLAQLYKSMADHAKAEPLYLEAKAIWGKVLGEEHPDYASNLHNLAGFYFSIDNLANAEPLYEEGLSVVRKNIEATAAVQTERQQLSLNQSLRHRLDSYLVMSLATPKLPKNAVENSLLSKGSVMQRLRGMRFAAEDPAIADQFSHLQSKTAQYSKSSQQDPAPQQAAAWRERVAKLKAEKEALEKQLIQSSSAFAGAMKSVTLADIQESLPAECVLVDYLEYNGKGGRRLLASMIRPSGESTMIDLGSAIELNKQINLWLVTHGSATEGQAAGVAIRQQVWEPLEKHLADAKFILVSPDGALGRLPLAALPGKQPGSYLIEEHPMALIPVPQLLPDLMQEQPSTAQYQLLALGDIDYDNAPTPAKLDQQPANYPDASSSLLLALRGRGQLPDTLRSSGGTWSKLAGTGPEVNYITQLYQRQHQAPNTSVVKLDATSASETAFRELAPHSRVIHVATHGFFASPDKKSALSGESIEAAAKQQMFTSIGDNQRLIVHGFSPGQLSGLVFAGANLRTSDFKLQTSPPLTPDPSPRSGARGVDIGSDDGILTADEIAFMRLENCELVVLSACETNVGAVAGGEGILGLQRAFQQAGARSTISSLWKVDDHATKTLMQLFYTNVWTHKQSKLEALRNAQLEILNHYNEATRQLDRSQPVEMKLVPKKDPQMSKSIDRSKRLSPRFWAAFQLSGDWR